MKKWLLITFCLITFIVFFNWNKTSVLEPADLTNAYNEEWGLKLPPPNDMQEVWAAKASIHGDGEWFNVFQYSNYNNNFAESGMVVLTPDTVIEAENKINHFIEATISANNNNEKIKKAFKQHPVQAQIGDSYYYDERNNGYDYFISLFKHDENKLYTLEWHQ